MKNKNIEDYRYFLKDSIRMEIDFSFTDQNRGETPPPPQKPYNKNGTIIDLVNKKDFDNDFSIDLLKVINNRKSVRKFSSEQLTLKELSFLLWVTQGVREIPNDFVTLRTVPSAGARHSFETYLYIRNVEGLKEGIYRYLALEHKLLFEFTESNLEEKIINSTLRQSFAGKSAVTFFWTTIPYRMEWRYSLAAHKVIAIDVGHVCQNLYLACEAINAGTCAIAAYDQDAIDKLLHLDGVDEFVIYLAPVGKLY